MTDYKANQEAIAKKGIQAQEFKSHPFYQHIEREFKNKKEQLLTQLRKVPKHSLLENIGRKHIKINLELDIIETWEKVISDAIRDGIRAQNNLKGG